MSLTLIENIQLKLKNKEYRKIAENFFSLSLLQVLNYILPLITFPYLVRVLGAEKFGLVAFAQSFNTYFMILVDYGFNLSGTRAISINRENLQKVSEIFSSIFTAKILLLIISFLALSIIISFVPKFKVHWPLYLLSFGMVIGNMLFPVWFFQGMQEMKYITILNFIAKIIFTVSIFLIVKSSSDYLYVPALNSSGSLIAGILSLWLIFKKFSINFLFVSKKAILRTLREGWYLFVSRVSISLYTTTNAFVLGLFESMSVVGYYVAAEKIIRVSLSLFTPVFRSLYPYISQKAVTAREYTISVLRRLLKYVGLISLLISIVFFIFAKPIILLVLGSKYLDSIAVFRILSFIPFIVALASILSNLTMVPFKLDRYLMYIYLLGGVINLVLILLFVALLKLHAEGAALANLLTEFVLTLSMFAVLWKNKINLLTYVKQ